MKQFSKTQVLCANKTYYEASKNITQTLFKCVSF